MSRSRHERHLGEVGGLAMARLLVTAASALVPVSWRARFREEWLSELWHEAERGGVEERAVIELRLLRLSLGALADAFAIRRLVRERRGRSSHHAKREGSYDMLLHDIRFAVRAFRKRPGWTAVVLVTLALAIGANTAVFGLVHAVLFRPLPFAHPDRLVKIQGRFLDTGELGNLSPADFYDLKQDSETISSMGAHGWVGFFTVRGKGEPERVPGSSVTAGFFETLAVAPARGRLFLPQDDLESAPPTVVLTDGFWRRYFGADPGVVRESVLVDAVSHEIIGVLPPGYRHPEPYPDREPALYTLYRFDRSDLGRSGHFIRGVGRLAEGRSIDEARAELTAIARRLEATYPDTNLDRGFALRPLQDAIVGDARSGLLVLFGAVAAVLLIACANLANLQLAYGRSRGQEIGIKIALGARRARLVRQLVTESLMLALAGGGLGWLLAYWAKGFFMLSNIPRADELSLDGPVLAFTFAASSLTAILFGLAPAVFVSREAASGVLSQAGSRRVSARGGGRAVLVATEVALSLILLVGAGLFLRSLYELRSTPPGFRPERVLSLSLSLPLARYAEGEQIPFYRELYQRLRSLPGVSALGAVNILPLTNNYSTDGFQIEERPAPEGEKPAAEARSVNTEYFEAMGIPLLKGRMFDERDRRGSPGVAIVSQAMAEKFWPGENPIGKRITYNRGIPREGRQEIGGAGSREIVGVVGDVKHLALGDAIVPMFYTPQAHDPSFHSMTLVIRADVPPESLAAAVRRELSAMDPTIPLYAVRTLERLLDRAVARPRFRAYVLGGFAFVALALALVGVYAVMGLVVSQRTSEIGVRMALGASVRDVVRQLVGESMRPVVWGIGLGLVGSLLLNRLAESLLYNVAPSDPATYALVAVLLAAAALVASALPTLRASRIDPVTTLRVE